MPKRVTVEPALLKWAIERSGKPLSEFKEPVAAWIDGTRMPTQKQIESFARRASVPVGYLFLTEPPREELPVPDYRTRGEGPVRRPTPNLIETIFAMERRQLWMREYLSDEGMEELDFVGSAKVGDNVPALAARIRQEIGIENSWADVTPTWQEALRFLRQKVEETGILIFLNGIVGNSTSRRLDPSEFQGFVLVDSLAPLIFVNAADYKVAQIFTIAHELAHVWVGENALFDLVATQPAEIQVEEYCNRVAAEFLVPAESMREEWKHVKSEGDHAFALLARRFKVSPIVVARRAKDLKLIRSASFFQFYDRYTSGERDRARRKASGGDFWRTQNSRLGRRFGRAVLAAAAEGRVSYRDAYDLTQLYGRTFDKYAQLLEEEARG